MSEQQEEKLFEEVWDSSRISSKPVPTVMSSEEKALSQRIKHLKEEKERVLQELDKALKACTHRVNIDSAGYMYDVRSCAICGGVVGLL